MEKTGMRLQEGGGLIDLRLMHGDMERHPNITTTFPQKFVDVLSQLYDSFGRIRVLIRYNRVMFLNEFEWERQMSQFELDESDLLDNKKARINNMRLIISSFTVVRLGEDGFELPNGRYIGRNVDNNEKLAFDLCTDEGESSSVNALATAMETSTLEPSRYLVSSGSIAPFGSVSQSGLTPSGSVAQHGIASSSAATTKRVLSDEVKLLAPFKKLKNEPVETVQSSSSTLMSSTTFASSVATNVPLKRSTVEPDDEDDEQSEEQLSVKRVRTEDLAHASPPVTLVFNLGEVPVIKFIDLSLGSFTFDSSSVSSLPCALDQSMVFSEDDD